MNECHLYGANSKNAANALCRPTVTGVLAHVIKNVFSRVRNTDNDMSSRSAAGKLFHTVGPLTVLILDIVGVGG